jgi:hypothetical protein
MSKINRQFAVKTDEDFYEYFDSLKDAVTCFYSETERDPIEVFEVNFKPLGKYVSSRQIKVSKVKVTKGKK